MFHGRIQRMQLCAFIEKFALCTVEKYSQYFSFEGFMADTLPPIPRMWNVTVDKYIKLFAIALFARSKKEHTPRKNVDETEKRSEKKNCTTSRADR